MKHMTLVVLAAGMGSRFGGLKQVTPVDDAGHVIIDFSVYDALLAGFTRIVFVIKRENEELFRETVGRRFEDKLEVRYAFQEMTDLPDGFSVPAERTKPIGTGHAVYAARNDIDGDFAVINSDDFYGRGAILAAASHLSAENNDHAMVAYRICNTLTENGSVNRGICRADDAGYLTFVEERLDISRDGDGAVTSDKGTPEHFDASTPVSMNMWAFRHDFLNEVATSLVRFLEKDLPENPLRKEFFLPGIVNTLMREGRGRARMLTTDEKWYGVTYREDLAAVKRAIRDMEVSGIYPENF